MSSRSGLPTVRAVRRERILPDGQRIVLFDDTERVEPRQLRRTAPRQRAELCSVFPRTYGHPKARCAAARPLRAGRERRPRTGRYSLRQVRDIRAVRNLVRRSSSRRSPSRTGSAAIRPSEAKELAQIGPRHAPHDRCESVRGLPDRGAIPTPWAPPPTTSPSREPAGGIRGAGAHRVLRRASRRAWSVQGYGEVEPARADGGGPNG